MASKTNDDIIYYHGDHLGSSNLLTDSDGFQVKRLEYTPFGTTYLEEGEVNTNYRYTGKELDQSTGLYYYGARYYDTRLGRFITPDTIVQAPTDPQTLNRYSYCRNNPLKYTDPSGEFFGFIAAIVKAIVTVVVKAVTTVATTVAHGATTAASATTAFASAHPVIAGATLGSATGGITAHLKRGDVGKGILFGGIIGGITGGILGPKGISFGSLKSPIAINAARGALIGASGGGIIGYGGGTGSFEDTIKGMGQGALYGAVAGGAKGIFSRLTTAMKMMSSSYPLASGIGKALSIKPIGGIIGGAIGSIAGSAVSDRDFKSIAGGVLIGGALGLATSGVKIAGYFEGSWQDQDPTLWELDFKFTEGKYAFIGEAKMLGMPLGVYGTQAEYQAGEVVSETKHFKWFKNVGIGGPLY